MRSFIYDTVPARVIFGEGPLDRLPEEIDRLGAKRAARRHPRWRAAGLTNVSQIFRPQARFLANFS
jgi:hypothetical protein